MILNVSFKNKLKLVFSWFLKDNSSIKISLNINAEACSKLFVNSKVGDDFDSEASIFFIKNQW